MFKECDHAFQLATEANMRFYVEICKLVYPSMEESVRRHLRYAVRAGLLRDMLRDELRMEKGQLNRFLPLRSAEECSGGLPVKTNESLGEEREDYIAAGIRPLQEKTIPASDVLMAFRRAEVARFDARSLLPKDMFNITIPKLQELHNGPGRSNDIPVLTQLGYQRPENLRCYEWLVFLAAHFPDWGFRSWRSSAARRLLVPLLLSFSCPEPASSLAELARRAAGVSEEPIPYGGFTEPKGRASQETIKRLGERRIQRFASVNLKRLPSLSQGFDLARELGISHLVEQTHSLLWMGANPGRFHVDLHDNLYIQLSEVGDVYVIPANCTSNRTAAFEKGDRSIRQLTAKREAMPFFHIRLQPGEGVTLPSMAEHRVVSRYSRRVAVNFFLEPRFGKLVWPDAPTHFFRRQNRHVAAMRCLWMRSVKRLWENYGISAFMHTWSNDFL